MVFNDETYTVAGLRPSAFACTVGFRCDITSVELPSTIVQIGWSAFAGCINLERMTIHAVTPPDADDLFSEDYVGFYWYDQYAQVGFDGNTLYDQVTLFVPNESIQEYRAHEELVNAYCTVVNDGVRNDPVIVTRIVDRDGKEIYRAPNHQERAMTYRSAWLMQQMLMACRTDAGGTAMALNGYITRPLYDVDLNHY